MCIYHILYIYTKKERTGYNYSLGFFLFRIMIESVIIKHTRIRSRNVEQYTLCIARKSAYTYPGALEVIAERKTTKGRWAAGGDTHKTTVQNWLLCAEVRVIISITYLAAF